MLKYNDLVYAKNEDYSYFRVMTFRPDKEGYLLECCDPRYFLKSYYKMVYLDQLEEKIITDKKKMQKYFMEEINKLEKQNKTLQEKKFCPDKNLEYKIDNINKEIETIKIRLEKTSNETEKINRQKAIRQLEKAKRRINKKRNYLNRAFIENITSQINKNNNRINKLKEDSENLEKLIRPENIPKNNKNFLLRNIIGNSIK